MMLSPRARLVLLLGALVVAAGALASCDASDPVLTEASETAGGLEVTPIPTGGRLLDLSPSGSRADGLAAQARVGGPSAYGCLVSTLRADPAGPAYGYGAVYVRFPGRVVREAGGRAAYSTFVLRSDGAPAHAATRVGSGREGAGIVRVARCRLPDTPAAGRMVKAGLSRFKAESWIGVGSGQAQTARAQAAQASAPGAAMSRASSECAEWEDTWWCTTVTSPGSDVTVVRCEYEGSRCVRYTIVDRDPWDGGGDPGGGDEPDPCVPADGAPASQICDGGGGAGPGNPGGPEPCDTGDPVIDDIAPEVEPQWEASNANDPDPFARREQGGWITRDPVTGRHRLVPFPDAFPRTTCTVTILPGSLPPNTVGMFHTHPFATGDTDDYVACKFESVSKELPFLPESQRMGLAEDLAQTAPYRGQPSKGDIDELQRLRRQGINLFGVIADKDGFVRYTADTDPAAPRGSLPSYAPCEYDPDA